ncbi:hypothetical protein ASD44_07055 [Mesorhizobium sp. Root554]|uniref:hypothetical protein n=1 Tax=unclassified Mesorhizobium TaxID=325217 RepID=UPI0006F41E3D|nr:MULTISPECIES: hypothetical protein [unclassified Mesorhizobium]KQZ13860.1 hypothetical protein ASD27_07060 [Mesorhizobium sp. Root1471]KQZ36372.1 hypothetical protein ASD44_07055 [Mesorhizobium sp. Root554]
MTYRMFLIAGALVLAGCVSQDDQKAEATQQSGLSQAEITPGLTGGAASSQAITTMPMAANAAAPVTAAPPPATAYPFPSQPAQPAASAIAPGMPMPAAPSSCKTTDGTTVCTADAPANPEGDRYNTN